MIVSPTEGKCQQKFLKCFSTSVDYALFYEKIKNHIAEHRNRETSTVFYGLTNTHDVFPIPQGMEVHLWHSYLILWVLFNLTLKCKLISLIAE